jgi:hypothetical protein
MKQTDEKERNAGVDKIIRILSSLGKRSNPVDLQSFLEKEKEASGMKTEEDYQKEQAEWLEKMRLKKKKTGE